MDITDILAAILNPNGSQQAILGPATAVGDHANPAALQAQMTQPRLPMSPRAPMAAQPTPMGSQQQPTLQSAPQAAPASSGGGFGDFVSSIFAPKQAARNKTANWLQSQGMDATMATAVASDPVLLRSVLSQKAQGAKASDFDQRAQAAQQYGMTPGSEDYRNFVLGGKLPEARGGTAEMSLNTIPGVDEQGNSVLIQVDKAGVAHKTAMPAGVKVSRPPLVKDTGTEFQVIDPVTREIVQTIPKNVAGAAAEEAKGKAQGAAAFDLPRVEQNAEETLAAIKELKDSPGRTTATGLSGTLDPRNYVAGTDATNFRTRLAQLKGQTFLQAYQMLKGAGQITEIEGKKAEDAIARLSTDQSDDEFAKALDDYAEVIQKGLDRARQQAGSASSTAGVPTFTANKDVFDAISQGKIKIGDEIILNGKRMRVDP